MSKASVFVFCVYCVSVYGRTDKQAKEEEGIGTSFGGDPAKLKLSDFHCIFLDSMIYNASLAVVFIPASLGNQLLVPLNQKEAHDGFPNELIY